ncbi:MAM and LDL-receptor class A domain-containing protein 1-like isoform X2 [Montipora foliosa]|uniref:MAM and LDL-receptor class A domain-containing protein 1-like isoform X2 n=1 Tax=Montipora foliosa TaxID=591990 RepID=UPI0035F1BDFE
MRQEVLFLQSLIPLLVTFSCGYRLLAPKEGDCNFDGRSFCAWHQVDNDNFDWTLMKGRTPSIGTGPQSDHTTRQKNGGYYAYIETSNPRRYKEKARMMSGPYSGYQCLQFAYSMVGQTIGELNIYRLINGQEERGWSKQGQQRGSDWKTDNFTVHGNNYYIIFEAIAGTSYTGDIAIDDIRLKEGPCNGYHLFTNHTASDPQNDGICDFNTGLCDWATDLIGADKIPWKLSSSFASKREKQSGIARQDHGKTPEGKFVFAKQTSNRAKKSRLINTKICGPKCIEFFYFLENFKKSEFRLSTRKDNQEDRLWFDVGRGLNFQDWSRGLVEINAEHETCQQLVFQAILHADYEAIVGLDDIFIANGSCCPLSNTPEDTAKANCTFDKGTFCSWKSSQKSTFEWSIGRGETASGKQSGGTTGPMSDASGAGNYAYIESSEPQMVGDKAILISDLLAGQQCMQFKYHMNGEDIGSLSIYRRGVLAWKESGNHGNHWLHAQIDLDCSMKEYHIEIEATVAGWRGDIAIDELTFTPGVCPMKIIDNAAAALRPTVKTSPPLSPQPPPYSVCLFDQNLCGWKNAYNDDGNWKINSGDTASLETGPQYDSDGNGYYIYMEASDLFNGQVVRLESKEFFTPICLHFHYHMYGKDIGELRLEQRNLKDNSTMVLWSRKGPQDDSWHSGLQDFYGDHYTVSFVAVRGKSPLGDIAIDEIGINEAKDCKVLNQTASKEIGGNPKEGNCDFEDNNAHFCKWANIRGDHFDWTRRKGRTPSVSTGPSFDHTKGSGKAGYYIYTEASNPRRRGDIALLFVKLEGKSFCMRFWYHMFGREVGSLKIMRITKSLTDDKIPAFEDFKRTAKVEWEKSSDQGNRWVKVEQELLADSSAKRLSVHWIGIMGIIGDSYTGDIAMDDIEFTSGSCSLRRSRIL